MRAHYIFAPLLGATLLVGCSSGASDQAVCDELITLEQQLVNAAEFTPETLNGTHTKLAQLAADAKGDLGDALNTLEPVFSDLVKLSSSDTTASDALSVITDLSVADMFALNSAATTINDICGINFSF